MDFTIVDSAAAAFVGSDGISMATIAREPYVDGHGHKDGALHCEISLWDMFSSGYDSAAPSGRQLLMDFFRIAGLPV